MADDEEGEEQEASGEDESGEKPGKSKKMLFLIIGAVVGLLLLIAVAVVVVVMMNSGKEETAMVGPDAAAMDMESAEGEGWDDEDEWDEDEEPLGALYPFDTFIVNLTEGGFMRCQMQIEFVTRDIPQRFWSRQIIIRDAILTLLTSKRKDDVLTVEGKRDLREEIVDVVNDILKSEQAKKIYFSQFVVQ